MASLLLLVLKSFTALFFCLEMGKHGGNQGICVLCVVLGQLSGAAGCCCAGRMRYLWAVESSSFLGFPFLPPFPAERFM